MPTQDPDSYLGPYVDAQREHGSDVKVTLWANERTQRLRFKVFSEMVFFTGKRVLDAGCSRGDFAAYLLEREQRYARFVGVDGVPEVVDFANGRGLEAAAFHAGDFVAEPALLKIGEPQVVAISGTLNTMEDDTAIGLLEHAWDAAGEALVFNFLSDTVSPKAPPQKYPARRLPTLKLLGWAFSQTSQVVLRQDYFPHGHDATILMRRG
ncbi:MAG: methyltransferase domain-containing protein [Planctomycetota bacterium]